MSTHRGELVEDFDGFIIAECSCGWSFPAPDQETAVDALVEHVQSEAIR